MSGLRERMREQALTLVRTEDLADVGYSYRILALDTPVAETLTLAGETLHAPWLLPASGELTSLAGLKSLLAKGSKPDDSKS